MTKKIPVYATDYDSYNVTFKTKDKFHPITRTLEVLAKTEFAARNIISEMFDSFKWDTKLLMNMPTEKHIHITKVKKLKKKEKKEV